MARASSRTKMCPASHITRRSSRRTRTGDRITISARKFSNHDTSTRPLSYAGGARKRSLRPPSDVRLQEVTRRVCPVIGILREISVDYRISSVVLGNGEYGVVRECEHRATRRILAIKSVDKSKVRRMDVWREVYLLHKINHQGIMKLVDFYEDDKRAHIVTERYTGGTLFDRIIKNTTSEGCFSECMAAPIIKSLLEAVVYLHDNDIVHRDIKPENILFESSREGAPVKIVDFGLSRKHKSGEAPMDNVTGTAYYMAREVLEEKYDRSCDVWSVGIIAYILLCGYPPFNGETDPDIFERIKNGKFGYFPETAWSSKSDNAKDFINCLLKIDPRRRVTARKALSHAWLKTYTVNGAKSNRVKQHHDLVARIKSLKTATPKFKKSVLVVQR